MKPNEDGPHDEVTGFPPHAYPTARIARLKAERNEAARAALEAELESARLEAALEAAHSAARDLQLQRDELLRAVDTWEQADWPHAERGRYPVIDKLLDARTYCLDWTPAERARDAQERAGRQHAAEAAMRHGG